MIKMQILSLLFFFIITSVNPYELTIVAKVNNEIITNIDLENRLKMALDLSKLPDEKEIKERLKPRVLDGLINEILKIQEANRLGIFVSNKEVTSQINRLETRLRIKKNSLLENYTKKGIPEITILNQIRSQLLWEKLIYNIIIKNISISDKQITETFDLLIKKSGEIEYNLSEIFISLDNIEAEQRINSIYSKINSKNFLLLAEQFSDSVISNRNTVNNWTRESLLNAEVKNSVSKLGIGQISAPVKTSSGYYIILLNDKRKTKKIEKNQTIYNLSQILFKLDNPNNTKQEKYYKEFLSSLKNTIKGCDDLDKLIDEIPEGYGGNLGEVDSKNIEKKFINVLIGLPIGQLSEAVTTDDGVHALMLCSPVANNTYEQLKKSVENNLRKNKIDSAAQSLLNRIRRKALIEISVL
ncbi:MAG: hypothetical protein CMJ08_01325 [Pelagibacterales bacterium]|nr:hypothetical protein [Pelagibacterales bacterium]